MKNILYAIFLMLGIQHTFTQSVTLEAPTGGANYQWYSGTAGTENLISGATNQVYTTTVAGVYFATYEGGNCKGVSDYSIIIDACNGDENITLNVGSSSGIFIWYKDGMPTGETGSSVTIEATTSLAVYHAEAATANCNRALPSFSVINLKDCQLDTDGDGIADVDEPGEENNPCAPPQPSGYSGYDASNPLWAAVDCDNDGVNNGVEDTNGTDPYSPTVFSEWNSRFIFSSVDCPNEQVCYQMELKNANGADWALADQNYRLFYDGDLMTVVSVTSLLPTAIYSSASIDMNGKYANQESISPLDEIDDNLGFLDFSITQTSKGDPSVATQLTTGVFTPIALICVDIAPAVLTTEDNCLSFIHSRSATAGTFTTQYTVITENDSPNSTLFARSDDIDDLTSADADACLVGICIDTDMDGITDVNDIDDDNDGISDVEENLGCIMVCDTDNDMIPDYLDLDADNDGINDVIEGGSGALDTNNDGMINNNDIGFSDMNNDGMDDIAFTISPNDTDGDTVRDFQDLDSDNDGITDATENDSPDMDNDGTVDNPLLDTDQDGVPDSVDAADTTFGDAGNGVLRDTDSDTIADFRDLDSDNDGINDVVEDGNIDLNNDGIIDNPLMDNDGDGIADGADDAPFNFGDGGDTGFRDSDGDGVPNTRDLDSDDDGLTDIIESGNDSADTDNDGTIDSDDVGFMDSDSDGIPDQIDEADLIFGDAGDAGISDDTSNSTDPNSGGTGTITDSGMDADGDGIADSVDGDDMSFGSNNATINCSLNLAVWLEGTYNLQLNEMNTYLNEQQLLPGQQPVFFLGTATPAGQPYHEAPWNYIGTEGDAFDATVTGMSNANYDPDVTDWVLVSLRNTTDANSTFCQQAAWLLKDGTIFFPGGCNCSLVLGSTIYIVIEHRNHLPVMTPSALTVTSSGVTYDFRDKQSYVTFTGDGQKIIKPNVFAMYAANGDQTSSLGSRTDINATDEAIWTSNNSFGDVYIFGDFDMNGDVNADDESLWLENTGKSSDVNN